MIKNGLSIYRAQSVSCIRGDDSQKLTLITDDLFWAMRSIGIKIQRVPFFEMVDLAPVKIIHLPFEHVDKLYALVLEFRKLIIS